MAMEADGELRDIVPPPTSLREAWSIANDLGDLRELYTSTPALPSQPAPSKDPPGGAHSEPVICAKGSLEGNTLVAIEDKFQSWLERGQTEIVLDILRCDQITPESAQRIYEMDQRARRSGGQLVVRGAAPPVRRVFEEAGLARALRFECSDKA
jgi:anti-anti-sigma factor